MTHLSPVEQAELIVDTAIARRIAEERTVAMEEERQARLAEELAELDWWG